MKRPNLLYIGNNLTQKTKYNSTLTLLSNLLKEEGYPIFISSDKSNRIIRLLEMCFAVLKYRKKVSYILIDTFSSTNFYYALCTSQMARLCNIKYIPILHGGNLPNRIKKSTFFSKLIFDNAYYNIAPSHYLKSAFEKQGYQVKFIPNIIEIENYTFKKRENIQPKLLWVRAFKKIYNPTMAIEVLHTLLQEYPKATLCMVGPIVDGTYENCLNLVEKYNLKDKVVFTGVLIKEAWHKKAADYDVFINTTNFDNTPISVMEAMALGLPVVSTNVGGIPYLLEDKKDALLVAPENYKEMTLAIVRILEGEFKNIPFKARQKVETFDSSIIINTWKEILK
ncbi:glycosyltransferase family 4 protein [uncultured Polaribacter sp.]|uniref:glycosyltransferase family 4 protein n=1 Tax=uncultured Polaribacter sp. TaxID=174711 RepID=UPI002611FD2B|nr:glycosyltransferase family 4 protein [uncultured Polaribacter sp.]